jgi:hypothetical protein
MEDEEDEEYEYMIEQYDGNGNKQMVKVTEDEYNSIIKT